ncbi:MAG TPA: PH domain-containing protein [Pirellulales bacterium]|nr:PH domain-containing protein [Pirellulales bacterium]
MTCRHCGAEIPPGAAFCPGCGERLADSPAGAKPDSQAAPPTNSPPVSKAEILQQRTAQVRHVGDVPEQELWRGTYSHKAMLGGAIGAGVATLIGLIALIWVRGVFIWIILGAILVLWFWIALATMRRRIGIRYRLTNQRFFIETGVFRRLTDRIEVIDINDMEFVQDFFERFFGVGSITLSTTEKSTPKVTLDGIDDVEHVFNLIDQARRAERNRRGLYIEAS